MNTGKVRQPKEHIDIIYGSSCENNLSINPVNGH